MPWKIVLLALVLLCSVPSCTPQKFDRRASLNRWFGSFVPGFTWQSLSDDISRNRTDEELWEENSRTSIPKQRTEHKTSSTQPSDNQTHSHDPGQPATPPSGDQVHTDPPEKFTIGGLLNFVTNTVECFMDPDECKVHEFFLASFSNRWDAWKKKYLNPLLNLMHVFSESPLIFLKILDHFLNRFFRSCKAKISFVESAFMWIFLRLFYDFVNRYANKSKFVSFWWNSFLIVQRLFKVLLCILGTSHMHTIMTSQDSSAVVICLIITDYFLNWLLSYKYDNALLTKLMIHEQIIYCRIIENVLQCKTGSCTCKLLIALAFVLYNKTQLWKYASRGSTLQGFDTLTWFGSWIWVLENACVLITRCYKMGMFPLLYIALPTGWHDSWTDWGLCMVSLGSLLYTFWSTHIFMISFAVLAAAEILIG
jgi:hypothetical protein